MRTEEDLRSSDPTPNGAVEYDRFGKFDMYVDGGYKLLDFFADKIEGVGGEVLGSDLIVTLLELEEVAVAVSDLLTLEHDFDLPRCSFFRVSRFAAAGSIVLHLGTSLVMQLK